MVYSLSILVLLLLFSLVFVGLMFRRLVLRYATDITAPIHTLVERQIQTVADAVNLVGTGNVDKNVLFELKAYVREVAKKEMFGQSLSSIHKYSEFNALLCYGTSVPEYVEVIDMWNSHEISHEYDIATKYLTVYLDVVTGGMCLLDVGYSQQKVTVTRDVVNTQGKGCVLFRHDVVRDNTHIIGKRDKTAKPVLKRGEISRVKRAVDF